MSAIDSDTASNVARMSSPSEVQAIDFGRRIDLIHAAGQAIAPVAFALKDLTDRVKEHAAVARSKGVWATVIVGALIAWGGHALELSLVTSVGWVVFAIGAWLIFDAAISEYAATSRKRELETQFSYLRFHWLAAGSSDFTLRAYCSEAELGGQLALDEYVDIFGRVTTEVLNRVVAPRTCAVLTEI